MLGPIESTMIGFAQRWTCVGNVDQPMKMYKEINATDDGSVSRECSCFVASGE